MSKLKLNLKEEDIIEEPIVDDFQELEIQPELELPKEDLFVDDTDEKLINFIDSPELNELRDIIIELPEEPHLLLLDDKAIVIAQEDTDNTTYLYCLTDEDEDFSLVKMPNELDKILSNDQIIQYTPSNISSLHDKVVELFIKRLNPNEESTTDLDEEIGQDSIDDIETSEEDSENGTVEIEA